MTDKRQLLPAAIFIKRTDFFLTILSEQCRLNHSFSKTGTGFNLEWY